MSDVTISDLPPIGAAQLTDVLPEDQGSTTYKVNLQQVLDLFKTQLYASMTNGQLLIGKTGDYPQRNNLTAGPGVTITNGAGTITISLDVTLPLEMADGGTGANLTPSNGGIVYTDASSMEILSGTNKSGRLLQSGNLSAPSWSTAAYPSTSGPNNSLLISDGTDFLHTAFVIADTFPANAIVYANSANNLEPLESSNNSIIKTNSSGVPSYTQTLPSAVQANITQVGTITSGTWNGSTISVSHGGTGNTSFPVNSIPLGNASNPLNYIDPLGNGQLIIGNASGYPVNANLTPGYGMAVVNGAGSIEVKFKNSNLTDGQLIIGSTGGDPVSSTLTAGDGINITNASGSIEISTKTTGIEWVYVTSDTMMQPNHGYICSVEAVVLTLPVTSPIGSVFYVMGSYVGGVWRVNQNEMQQIADYSTTTTIGLGGYIQSTSDYNAVQLVTTIEDTLFQFSCAASGNIDFH